MTQCTSQAGFLFKQSFIVLIQTILKPIDMWQFEVFCVICSCFLMIQVSQWLRFRVGMMMKSSNLHPKTRAALMGSNLTTISGFSVLLQNTRHSGPRSICIIWCSPGRLLKWFRISEMTLGFSVCVLLPSLPEGGCFTFTFLKRIKVQ